jgi:D-serine deaminase-like pyridoxal phosphate-dependent protein
VPDYARLIGCPKETLDTPALIVDLDRMDRNIARMARIVRDAGVQWRPHVKSAKNPDIAQRMIRAGAIGVTCAKVGEAEAMAAVGIRDILIANQVAGSEKVGRLMRLLPAADVMICVDGEETLDALDRAARDRGVSLRVAIEVDVGMERAGVRPGEPTVSLGARIAARRNLRFGGLMTFEAHALGIPDPEQKRKAVSSALESLVESARRCRQAGLPVDVVSCGGTGTYWIAIQVPGITEVQAGGGIFSDTHYQHDYGVEHELALTALATVTSRPNPTRVICDTGRKALTMYGRAPAPLNVAGVRSVALHAEHTVIELDRPSVEPQVGARVELSVGHVDYTIHLHDELYGVRNGKVEVVWPVLPRSTFR